MHDAGPGGLLAASSYLAGPDPRRLDELRRALADRDARAVWVARGGYGATRLLGDLAAGTVAAAGKVLIGFSDATALHALWLRAGLPALHGPNISTLAEWSEAGRVALLGWLRDGRAPVLPGRLVRGDGGAEGTLVGGNLTVLAALAGTGYLPATAGCLLFLEDVDEAPYRLDRALTQLRQAHALDGVKAVVVGQLERCGPSYEAALEGILNGLGSYRGPVLAGVPVGHGPDARPLLLGGGARIEDDRLEAAAGDFRVPAR